MAVQVSLELAPFKVPSTVSVKGSATLKQMGFEQARQIHLSELSIDVLSAMCAEFTTAVLAQAKTEE